MAFSSSRRMSANTLLTLASFKENSLSSLFPILFGLQCIL
jgi:hypothetical protein